MTHLKRRLTSEGIFISAVSVVSKVLGVVREVTLAYFFGTSGMVDAYRIAVSAVFLPLNAIAGFALTDSLIPTFNSLWITKRRNLLWVLVNQLTVVLLLVTIALVALEIVHTEKWIRILAPGFDQQRVRLAVTLTRWIALAMPFYLITSLMIVVLNSFYVFKAPSLRPLVTNLFLIGGVVAAVWKQSPAWLGRVYPIAFICFGLYLLPLVRRRWQVRWTFRLARARGVWSYYLQAFLPLLAFITIQRVNYLADRVISSYLAVGSISALEYSRFIVETPVTTLGLGLIQVALPLYSDLSATGRLDELVSDVKRLLQFGFMIMVPLSCFMWIESEDIIRVLFGYGRFETASIETTASTLRGFSIGLWAWFCAYFLQRIYNARRRNRRLLLFAAVSLACNVILNIILAQVMGIQGIAVATSVASILFFSLLVVWFEKRLVGPLSRFLGILLCGGLLLAVGLSRVAAAADHAAFRILLVAILGGGGWLGWLWLFSETRDILRAAAEAVRGRLSH